ncbi:MAG: translation initiation factor IF-3 [bacterium]
MNEAVKVPTMRLLGPEGDQIGIESRERALQLAVEFELDLVLISPNAEPPVCRIMDYDKFRYQQIKKIQKAQKKQKKVEIKELRMRPNISSNDLNVKIKRAKEFLEDGNKVKLNLQFVGRENLHVDIGEQIAKKFMTELAELSTVEQQAKKERRSLIMILAPLKK